MFDFNVTSPNNDNPYFFECYSLTLQLGCIVSSRIIHSSNLLSPGVDLAVLCQLAGEERAELGLCVMSHSPHLSV